VSPRSFGIEAITDDDRAYRGSRFSEVCEALFANPYQRTWGADDLAPLEHSSGLLHAICALMSTRPNHSRRQLLANAAMAPSRVAVYPWFGARSR